MRLVYGNSKAPADNAFMAAWAAQIIWPGTDREFGPCGTIGCIEGDELLGVAVLHNWQPDEGTIEVSAASKSPRWLTRRMLKEIFVNCFDVHKCQLVFSRVAENDERTRRIYRAYGFTEILLPRMRGRDKNEILLTLYDDAWRASKWSK